MKNEEQTALSNESKGGNITYLTIVQGSLRQKVADGTNGSYERTNKDGKKVSEFIFNRLSGRITNVQMNDGNYGKELHITIMNGGNKYLLQATADSAYAFGFFRRMLNIDFGKDVVVKVSEWTDRETQKKRTALTIAYFHETEKTAEGKAKEILYDSFFTKEEPKGLPELEEVVVNGKKMLDSTKRIMFLEDVLYKKIVPVLIENYYGTEKAAETKTNEDFLAELESPAQPTEEEAKAEAKKNAAKDATAKADELEALAKKNAAKEEAVKQHLKSRNAVLEKEAAEKAEAPAPKKAAAKKK